jgi:hypothetical protein
MAIIDKKKISVADPDPGSVIRYFDPWIRDPGWVKSKDPDLGCKIRDEQLGSYFLELRNHFFSLKYLNSLMRMEDFGSGIGDAGWKKVGSEINIPDPQHGKKI